MELTEKQKQIAIAILSSADGEDVDQIVKLSGWIEYLTHSLIMRCSDKELEYYLEERNQLHDRGSNAHWNESN